MARAQLVCLQVLAGKRTSWGPEARKGIDLEFGVCAAVATAGPSQALAHDTPVWPARAPFCTAFIAPMHHYHAQAHRVSRSRSHTSSRASSPFKVASTGCTLPRPTLPPCRSRVTQNNALASRHIHRQAPNQQHHTASMSVFDNIILATDSYKVPGESCTQSCATPCVDATGRPGLLVFRRRLAGKALVA